MNIKGAVDGKSIAESVAIVLDKIKYRKFADKGYTIVIWINKENTTVKILDGSISGTKLNIPSQDAVKMVNKVYIAPSKKIVTRLCFVKEDINTTLDILVKDTSKISAEMFKQFVKIKILEDLQTFNLGQVVFGGAIGLLIGIALTMMILVMYGVLL